MRDQLTLREDTRRDLTSRVFTVRAATINEEERSVEAVLATENPIEVYDWLSGERVDEVLVMAGATLPSQMPILNNHSRWSLDDVLGSIRSIRVEGSQMIGRLHFARDEDSERAWQKVRDGHLTDVSVGYRVGDGAVRIPAGQSATVNGRSYTAGGKRALRITTNWMPREGSLTPIGADMAAKIRGDISTKGSTMNKRQRKYLASLGLRADAGDAQATEFLTTLTDAQRAEYERLATSDTATNPPAAPAEGQRAEVPAAPAPAAPPPASPAAAPDPTRADAASIARQAVADERERVRSLTDLARSDVPPEILRRAIDEGWTTERASGEFLAAVREHRQPEPIGPAIHSRSLEADLNARSLAAGLLASGGLDPTQCHMFNARDTRRGEAITAQDAERGDRFRQLSAIDLCRACAQLDGGRWHLDPSEAIRTALSGATLAYVFSTNVYARLMAGWAEVADTTGWCDVEDVANFLQQENITVSHQSRMAVIPRGGTAPDATLSDSHETYKIARYGEKFVLDEQDFIDDRLGALLNIPMELGRDAARLRPDLVYSLLLANAALISDSTALFEAGTHANLGSAALAAEALSLAIGSMMAQREGSGENAKVLNITPRFLIVPSALQFTAATILTGGALAKTHATKADPNYIPINPVSPQMLQIIMGQQMTLVVDDRIGATGVWDPSAKTTRTGSATNWFLSAGGPRTVRVIYRRGTGRMPQLRSFTLDRGQWGLGWDINLDIGAKAIDYRGLYKSTGDA